MKLLLVLVLITIILNFSCINGENIECIASGSTCYDSIFGTSKVCENGLKCIHTSYNENGTCQAGKKLGELCFYNDCEDGLECLLAEGDVEPLPFPHTPYKPRYCTNYSYLGIGEICNSNSSCMGSLKCLNGKCQSNNNNGCESDFDCPNQYYCNYLKHKCEKRIKIGEKCNSDNGLVCSYDSICENGKCVKLNSTTTSDKGKDCSNNEMCESQVCDYKNTKKCLPSKRNTKSCLLAQEKKYQCYNKNKCFYTNLFEFEFRKNYLNKNSCQMKHCKSETDEFLKQCDTKYSYLFLESTIINCAFYIPYYGNLEIINSKYFKSNHINSVFDSTFFIGDSNFKIINSTFESVQGLTGNRQNFIYKFYNSIFKIENVTFSKFEYYGGLLVFSLGIEYASLKNVQFKDCKSLQFIKFDYQQDNNNNNSSSNSIINLNNIKLINNQNYIFILLNYKIKEIVMSNIKILGCGGPTSSSSFILFSNSIDNSNSLTNVILENSELNCIGSSLFLNSNVKFKNVEIKSSIFSNYFISIKGSGSSFELISSLIIDTSNTNFFIDSQGSFLKLDKDSTVSIKNSTFINSSFVFIDSSLYENSNNSIIILDSNFTNTQSNFLSFIFIKNSTILIYNCNFNKFKSSYESLIEAYYNSNLLIENSIIKDSSFGLSIISSTNSTTIINQLTVFKCFTQSALLYSTKSMFIFPFPSPDLSTFLILNSNFIDNTFVGNINNTEKDIINNLSNCLIFTYSVELNLRNSTFTRNSFSPIIKTIESNVNMDEIIFNSNTGSFFISWKSEINMSNFQMKNIQIPVDYLFCLLYSNSNLTQISIENNYFKNYLIMILNGTIEFNDFKYSGNVITNSNLNGYPFIIEPPNNYYIDNSQILIFNSDSIKFKNLEIFNNILLSDLIYFQGSDYVIFENCNISLNHVTQLSSSIIYSMDILNLIFLNSSLISNHQDLNNGIYNNGNAFPSLLYILNSNLIIDSCEMSNNSFTNGGVINYQINSDQFNLPIFEISNSIFNFNNASNNGGVLSIFTTNNTCKPISKFINNSFSFNWAKGNGGVIYSSNYPFKENDLSIIYYENIFQENSCIYGENDFASDLQSLVSISGDLIYCSEPSTIQFAFLDYYNQTAKQISGQLEFNIGTDYTPIICLVSGGIGSFVNNYDCGEILYYYISSNDYPSIGEFIIYNSGCSPYKYYNINDTCFFCPIGLTTKSLQASENGAPCRECIDNVQTCIESTVFAHDGYYQLPTTNFVLSCPIDMCFQNNTCPSELYTGDLCFTCLYPDNNQNSNNNNSNLIEVVAKNGIRCCTDFKPILLIPILLIIFITFSLTISTIIIIKYYITSSTTSFDHSIIIFLQTNSIVYFPYSGIYFLPLFRLSIDMIDGWCLFKSLDYNGKVLISYSIIILFILIILLLINLNLFKKLILKFLFFYYSKNNQILKRIKSNSKKKNNNKFQIYWSLFQILFIPLMFNSISILISYKEFHNWYSYLMVDFSIIVYKSNLSRFLYILSCIIISIIGLLIIKITFTNFKQRQRQTQTKIYQPQFWYLIEMIRSSLFIIFTLILLFNPNYHMVIIISIQIIYTIIHFLLAPFYLTNNLINISQLIIFIISSSLLFGKLPKSNYKGAQNLYYYDTSDFRNPDFAKDDKPDYFFTYDGSFMEKELSVVKSMVYAKGDTETYDAGGNFILIDNATTFNAWTKETTGVTATGQYEVEILSGYYNESFWVVDGLGFGNEGENHNYKWCVRIEFDSLLNPTNIPSTITINHSDDLLIFLNNTLVFTYMGLGDNVEGTHDLQLSSDSLKTTPLEIINCNRKRRDIHVFGIKTNFELQCEFVDECGVCNGDASSCTCIEGLNCKAEEFNCIYRSCEENVCVEEPFNCSYTYENNACVSSVCNLNEGCRSISTDCNDNNHCTIDTCDQLTGCINTPIDNCVDCDVPCTSPNACYIAECHPTLFGECVLTYKNCSHPNPCIQGGCDLNSGDCNYFEIGNCVPCDGKQCLTDDLCSPSICVNTDSGPQCISTPLNCTHPNPCVIGQCSFEGNCEYIENTDCLNSSSDIPFTTTATTTLPITSTTTTTTSSPTTTTTSTTTSTTSTTGLTSTTISTTISSTISFTTDVGPVTPPPPYDVCYHHKCPHNQKCNNINGVAVCSITNCLSCDDLNCPSQGLKCISVKQDHFKNKCSENCCEYIATCSN